MKKNMGNTDRLIRIVLGVVFLLAIVLQWVSGVFAVILGVLAVVFIATASIKMCPLYTVLGIQTVKDKSE